ncbi:hypothetical protein [Desulfoluna limicola]|uniref:hypothetical protein n=1 Tax=Desulfoluna limicola TaxID=2810562 RepID=UPI001F413067|nr:hypothetical protein [Desulfoluna limicola]
MTDALSVTATTSRNPLTKHAPRPASDPSASFFGANAVVESAKKTNQNLLCHLSMPGAQWRGAADETDLQVLNHSSLKQSGIRLLRGKAPNNDTAPNRDPDDAFTTSQRVLSLFVQVNRRTLTVVCIIKQHWAASRTLNPMSLMPFDSSSTTPVKLYTWSLFIIKAQNNLGIDHFRIPVEKSLGTIPCSSCL